MDVVTNSPSYKACFFTSGDSTPDCRVPYQAWDSTLFQRVEPQIGTLSQNVVSFEALSQMEAPNGAKNEHLLPPSFIKETKRPVAATIHPLSCQPYIKKQSKKAWSTPAKNIWKDEVEHMLSGTLMDIFKDVRERAYFDGSPSVMDQLHQNFMGDDSIVTSASSATAAGMQNKVLPCSYSTQSPPHSTSISGSSSDNSALSKVSGLSDVFQPDQFLNVSHDKSNMMEYTVHNLEAWFSESVDVPFSSTTALHNRESDQIIISSIKIEDSVLDDDTRGNDTTDSNEGEAVDLRMFWGHYDDNRQQKGITVLPYKGDIMPEHHGVEFERAFSSSLGSIYDFKIFNQNSIASGSKQLCLPPPNLGQYYHSVTNHNGLLSEYLSMAQNNENKPLGKHINGGQLDNVCESSCNMCPCEGISRASQKSNKGSLGASAGKSQVIEPISTLTSEQVSVRFENGCTESGLVHLLTAGAEAMSRRDMDLASVILVRLKGMVSHLGSTMQRVAAYFIQGLEHQVEGVRHPSLPGVIKSQGDILAAFQILHEIFPYIKFGHFTANQAILEAVQGERRVHIVDFEIMEGIQWPGFMQALVSQKGGPAELRITALCRTQWQHELALVQKTGERLSEFASALNLPFRFSLLKTNTEEGFDPCSLKLIEGEALVVNCMVHLPHMPRRSVSSISSFLQEMHKLSPRVLTIVEEELGCNTTPVTSFFSEAVHHFYAICDSLEACLPSAADACMLVERVFVAPRIDSVMTMWGGALSLCWQPSATETSNNYGWTTLVHATGFRTIPLSSHNQSQARLLLGLHRDGFNLEERSHSLVLGWQSRPLFSASVWK